MSGQQYEATTIGGFVQQIAVSYIGNGYFFYVTGRVPERKDPNLLDRKFEEAYGLDISKWSRSRRKQAGYANVRYIRFERFFVLLATAGEHEFFANEGKLIRDVRRVPLKFGGYSMSHRGGHAHVRIEQETYKMVKAHLVDLAVRRSVESLEAEFRGLPFEPYRPVVRQVLTILRAVNRVRKAAGYQPVPAASLRMFREIYRPFAPVSSMRAA
jgi:hypothetical protein